MPTCFARIALILFALAGLVGGANAQASNTQADRSARMKTLADASAAADSGDAKRAVYLLEPFANQGDPVFQNMLGDLYAQGGAEQDNQMYDFATDIDNTQSAEIKIMQGMLSKEKK